MNIRIKTIAKLGATSIADAIEKIAQESDTIASGIIVPSFSCSGPGAGWQKNHDVHDYAMRALEESYGALSYIDSEDGREAEMEDGNLVWSEESVVEIEIPTLEDAIKNPEEYAILAKDAARYVSANEAEEWAELAEKVENYPTREQAKERINGSLTNDGESVIYYDDGMSQHYICPVEDLDDLRALMADDDEDVARDAYSHWCAGTSHSECDEEGNLTEE